MCLLLAKSDRVPPGIGPHYAATNLPCVVGTGLRLVGTGLRLVGTGVRLVGTGVRLVGTGLRPVGTGLRLVETGLRLVETGLRLVGTGQRPVGDRLRPVGRTGPHRAGVIDARLVGISPRHVGVIAPPFAVLNAPIGVVATTPRHAPNPRMRAPGVPILLVRSPDSTPDRQPNALGSATSLPRDRLRVHSAQLRVTAVPLHGVIVLLPARAVHRPGTSVRHPVRSGQAGGAQPSPLIDPALRATTSAASLSQCESAR